VKREASAQLIDQAEEIATRGNVTMTPRRSVIMTVGGIYRIHKGDYAIMPPVEALSASRRRVIRKGRSVVPLVGRDQRRAISRPVM